MVWLRTSTFGSQIGVTAAQCAALEALDTIPSGQSDEGPFQFPAPKLPSAFDSIIKLTQSIEIATTSPFPRWHHWLILTLNPSLRSARQHKDRLVGEQLSKAMKKFSEPAGDVRANCAIDLLVQREVAMAKKEQRASNQNVEAIEDELFGFLLAAHDTTATSRFHLLQADKILSLLLYLTL